MAKKGTKGIAPPPPRKTAKTKGSPTNLQRSNNLNKESTGEMVLINFRVTPEFRKELKLEAMDKGISMTDLFYKMFSLWKKTNL